eukprot:s882_g2.t1
MLLVFILPKTGISFFGVRFGCVALVVRALSFRAHNLRKNLQGSVALKGAEVFWKTSKDDVMARSLKAQRRDELLWVATRKEGPKVVKKLIRDHGANQNQAERAMMYLVGLGNLGHPDSSTCVWLEICNSAPVMCQFLPLQYLVELHHLVCKIFV